MPRNIFRSIFIIILIAFSATYAQTLLNESFSGTTFPPTGWTIYSCDGDDTHTWERNTASERTSPACTYAHEREPNPGTYPNNDWIVTPKLYPTTSNCTLKFYYRDYCGAGCSLEVWVSRAGNTPADFQNALTGFKVLAFTGTNTSYKSKKVVLSSFVNQLVYIAFRYCGKITNRQGVYIDDVSGIPFPTLDVGVSAILSPDTVVAHGSIYPQANIINLGSNPASFYTRCEVETITGARTVYRDSVYYNNLPPNQPTNISYSNPATLDGGRYRIKFKTLLASDMQPSNDTMSKNSRVIPPYHDVGVTAIFSPIDTVSYNASIYPSVQVKNYGSGPENSIPITIKIRNLETGLTTYTGSVTASLLSLQTGTVIVATPWTVTLGSYQVIAYTTLGTDQNRVNDTGFAYTYSPLKDVGVDSIFRPNVVELSTGFNPQVWVKNYGVISANFWTRCEIETITGARIVYRDSVLVSNLYPSLTVPLSFSLAALNPGFYRVKVRTLYNGDVVLSNDEKTKEFTVTLPIYHDAGVTEVITPIGELQYNTSYTPSVQVRNFGNQDESNIPVTIKIIRLPSTTVYTTTGTISLTSFTTGTYTATTSWTAAIGTYQVISYTTLLGDQNLNNDTCLANAQCSQKDVGVISINQPDTVELPGPLNPQAQVQNFGQQQATFWTRCEIESLPTYNIIYRDSIQTTLNPGSIAPFSFNPRTFNGGSFRIKVITLLNDDAQRSNDTMVKNLRVIPNDYKDAGVSAVIRPMGELDYQTAYQPSVQVRNYGAQAESIPVIIKIINLQTYDIVHSYTKKIWLTPLQSGMVNDAGTWTTSVGVFKVMGFTSLNDDGDRTNDTCNAGALVSNIDAAVFSIDNPASMVEPTFSVIPTAKILNNSWKPQTFNATFRINDSTNYSDTRTITLGASKDTTLSFNAWLAYPGNFALYCSTSLSGDMNLQNNKKTSTLFVPYRDIAAVTIIDPDTLIDPTQFIPRAMIFNNSNYPLTTSVEMAIFDSTQTIAYCDTARVDIIATTPGVAYFEDWSSSIAGRYTARIRTLFSPDLNPNNDTITKALRVRTPRIDIAIVNIVSPGDTLGVAYAVYPKIMTYNYGNVPQTFRTITEIMSGPNLIYICTSYIYQLPPQQQAQISGTAWQPQVSGPYSISSRLDLSDAVDTNNQQVRNFTVVNYVYRDVGVARIVAPDVNQPFGNNLLITPAVMLSNSGNVYENLITIFKISKLGKAYPEQNYPETLEVNDIAPHVNNNYLFAEWAPMDTGRYVITCETYMAGDANPNNNVKSETIRIYIPLESGWKRLTDIPPLLGVKAGGALTYVPNVGIYAFPGNKTSKFYCYSINDSTWTGTDEKQSLPTSKKTIGKGAALCNNGSNTIYAVRGNNTRDFWRYDCAENTWYPLDSVPPGPKNKKLNGGSGLAYVAKDESSFVFLVKGNSTFEFYAYYVEGDTWLARESIPRGEYGKKIKIGTCMTSEQSNIYVLKSEVNELYRYDVLTNTWQRLQELPLNYPGNLKQVKVKDGSALTYDGTAKLYAFKGNTYDFWSYVIDRNTWIHNTNNTVPPLAMNKKVKIGAALTSANGLIYALKGNKTREFLRYSPRPGDSYSTDEPSTINAVMTAQTSIKIQDVKITIKPNIIKDVARIHYQVNDLRPLRIKIYNTNGMLVRNEEKTLSNKNGIFSIDISEISAGIYFLQVESGNNKFLEKVIVQK